MVTPASPRHPQPAGWQGAGAEGCAPSAGQWREEIAGGRSSGPSGGRSHAKGVERFLAFGGCSELGLLGRLTTPVVVVMANDGGIGQSAPLKQDFDSYLASWGGQQQFS